MGEPRPTKATPEMKLKVARLVAQRLAEVSLIDADQVEEHAADIAEHGDCWSDGYRLAKTLDDSCYWECNFEIVEELDCFASALAHEIEAAEKIWAEQEALTPPFSISTRVKLKSGELGEIKDIYKYGAAKFCVAIDGDPRAGAPQNARRIVNFEDVTAAE
jgi:hypothetical protein